MIAACRKPQHASDRFQNLENVKLTQLDVSDPQSVQTWAEEVRRLTPHVDMLINNAGIYGPKVHLDDITATDMMNVFAVNAVGPLMVVQQLRKQGVMGGSSPTLVANVTSKVGSITDNTSGGRYAYRASKNALNIITKSLSIDLADENVTCTLLHPGWVQTDMTEGKGLITPGESVAGMLNVLLQKERHELQGMWYDYKNESIPW